MTQLLLDLGNSRVKWALAEAGSLGDVDAADWQHDSVTALVQAWARLPRPQTAWAASVVDTPRESAVAAAVLARFGLPLQWVRTPAAGCGVRNAYAVPADLGVDRFLAMVAAWTDGLAPCVLAGCGTALTVDALAADGHHLGGLIAPGPRLMQQAVRGATARVDPVAPGQVVEAATGTADALVSGCWQACAGLVERFDAHMADALGATRQLLLAGGDAASLARLLPRPALLRPDAVLRGLAAWAATHP